MDTAPTSNKPLAILDAEEVRLLARISDLRQRVRRRLGDERLPADG